MAKHHINITALPKAAAAVAAALALGCGSAAAFAPSAYADTSRLNSGRWVKIKVDESGFHQITADDARRWGFGDVSRLRVFGYGGAQLSEKLTADLPDDLPQVAVTRTGGKIVFYAQGPTTWTTSSNLTYVQSHNPYSTAGYYFVTDNQSIADATVAKASTPVVEGGTEINTFTGRTYHEKDIDNPGETGRTFLGEDFRYTTSQAFKFSLPGLVSGSEVSVLTSFAAKTMGGTSSVKFQYNGTNLPSSTADEMAPVEASESSHIHYVPSTSVKRFDLSGTGDLTYTVTFKPSGTLFLARLDYITVNYRRQLALGSDGLLYFGFPSGRTDARYALSGASASTHIWDVTNVWQPVEMNASLSGNTASFSATTGGRREYAAFNEGASLPSPTMVGTVANQNIHGSATPDMIIIAPSEYVAQAQRVAQLHESADSMRVLVLNQNAVFNEFSSGTPDAMAYRRVCKMFYDRGTSTDGHRLGYLLLMGNGSYDNRQISDKVKLLSYPMLLTWQSAASATESSSYTSDDPFGILADGSGPAFASSKIDISVGRFPVKSVAEARTCVDKLIKYVTKPDYGKWKMNVLNVADDENNAVHMEQADAVISTAQQNGAADFMFNRVYIDAFENRSNGGGRYYPDARKKMYNTLSDGVVWWNYTGHAGPTSWTNEGLMTITDIEQNLYYNHEPILYAATCEFTRFDATATSGGEYMFLNPRGGAISVICPPRLVFISNNGNLNRSVAKYIFAKDASGRPLRLGDILRRGKNDTGSDDNNSRYFLFGDPAMRPAYPTAKVAIESINGADVTTTDPAKMPVFKARQKISVEGHIADASGKPLTDFNGPVTATLYDSEQSVTTHGYGGKEGKEYTYQDRSNKLTVTVDSVKDGRFKLNLTIPSEVIATTDNYSPALLSVYANNPTDSIEAMGSNSNFYIYGYDDAELTDTIGPEIKVFGLNSEDFKDGSNVNESPLVIARVADESGINLSTSGVGHTMTLMLDGNKNHSDLSTYYTPEATESGYAGTLHYQLSDLANGQHTLRLKVWDVFNNSSERTISFNVINGLKPEVYSLYTDANPATVEANFYVRHNRPDATLRITLSIYDLLGREVWSTQQSGRSDMFRSSAITWDLTDRSGRRVPRGIYVCRASVSTDGVQEATKAQKIAVASE